MVGGPRYVVRAGALSPGAASPSRNVGVSGGYGLGGHSGQVTLMFFSPAYLFFV